MPQSTPGERTPLLNSTLQQDCCSSTKGCCSAPKSHTTPSSCFNDSESACCQQQSQVNNADYCQLAEQPWQYKAVALICALLLAGMFEHIIHIIATSSDPDPFYQKWVVILQHIHWEL